MSSPQRLLPLLWPLLLLLLPRGGASLRFAVPYVQSGEDGGAAVLHKRGLRGAGETIGVIDTGVDYHHTAFHDPAHPAPIPADALQPAHRKVAFLTSDFNGAFFLNDTRENGHGTGMCGAAAGGALRDTGPTPNPVSPRLPPLNASAYVGMAPHAKVAVFSVSRTADGPLELPRDLYDALQRLYAAGARVFVMAFCGGGPAFSAAANRFAWNYRDAVLVGAAGNKGVDRCGGSEEAPPPPNKKTKKKKLEKNRASVPCSDGTVCHPQLAKNALTVGATQPLGRARAAAGYPHYVLAVRCKEGGGGFVWRNVTAYRAEFSPYPMPVVDALPLRQHQGGERGCEVARAEDPHAPPRHVAVALRGECTFAEKAARNAASAAMMVVVNNAAVWDGPMQAPEGEERTPYLPSVMIAQGDGAALMDGRCDSVSGPFTTDAADPTWDAENLLAVSARGAVRSQRIKPDLVAPGALVMLPRPNTTNGLISHTGSSVAAALIGGAAALVREALRTQRVRQYTLGAHRAAPGASPAAAAVRALLVHPARKLTGTVDRTGGGATEPLPAAPPPDMFQGYGRTVLAALLPPAEGAGGAPPLGPVVFEGTLESGAAAAVCFRLASAGGLVTATLSWIDPSASMGVKAAIDVTVHTPSQTHHGPPPSQAESNLQRWVLAEEPGEWAAVVARRPGDAITHPIPYALVVSAPAGGLLLNGTKGCAALHPLTHAAPAPPSLPTVAAPRRVAVGGPPDTLRGALAAFASAAFAAVGVLSRRRRVRMKNL
eukprot:TRINITY_DN15264_c0_g1_i1.p1 TRINITY_DN15264_c0_g1~~TRINITY_DN15264_c0_g1_i1.p1  ORF type:complete len:771 (+),score=198.80 TRINITY_DN15264_c0_g1_i1:103-2415(+)